MSEEMMEAPGGRRPKSLMHHVASHEVVSTEKQTIFDTQTGKSREIPQPSQFAKDWVKRDQDRRGEMMHKMTVRKEI